MDVPDITLHGNTSYVRFYNTSSCHPLPCAVLTLCGKGLCHIVVIRVIMLLSPEVVLLGLSASCNGSDICREILVRTLWLWVIPVLQI